jgi:hypothetical protein
MGMMNKGREKVDASQLEIKDTVVSINRVTKVVKGGKNLSFSALVVVGDGHGVVGFGVGKAKEVPSAIKKGIEAAKKSLIKVPLKGTTIPHQVVGKFGSGSVLLKPAPEGHRTHCRRRGASRGRVGGHSERVDQVARIGEPAQRRTRDVQGLDGPEGSRARCSLSRQRVSGAGRSIGVAATKKGAAKTSAKKLKITLVRSPIGFNKTQGLTVRGWPTQNSAHRGVAGYARNARHDPQGSASRGCCGVIGGRVLLDPPEDNGSEHSQTSAGLEAPEEAHRPRTWQRTGHAGGARA